MASSSFSEDDFSCPVCCEVFKDPVLLSCTHSVCKSCLQQFWKSKGSEECPVCREGSSNHDPPLNRHLKNLSEAFLRQRSRREPFCDLHQSELKLYCEDDKQLVCLVCRDSKLHKNHNCSPISEAAQEHKEQLQLTLEQLQKKLGQFFGTKLAFANSAGHIKVQAQHTEKQIKQEFEKLHQLLRDEEAARIAALREEEEQKRQVIKEKIEQMDKDLACLSDGIKAIEETESNDDISFLQNYKSTVERAQCTLQDPEKLPQGALISVAKHLGNLKFRVWEKMKDLVQYMQIQLAVSERGDIAVASYLNVEGPSVTEEDGGVGQFFAPVILDPNTANPKLLLSEDLGDVKGGLALRLLPDNPERFDSLLAVLGSEGFTSGTHCCDVQVGEADPWFLGVTTESNQRKGVMDLKGLWVMYHGKNDCGVYSASKKTNVGVRQRPQKIRVQLDLDRRTLTFSDFINNRQVRISLHASTERVFPYFCGSSFKILPSKAAVTVKQ